MGRKVNGRMKSVKVCRQVYFYYHPRRVALRMRLRLSNKKTIETLKEVNGFINDL